MTRDTPITRLRRAIAAAERGEPMAPDDAAWLTEGVQRYLVWAPTSSTTLCMALGLKRRGHPWWRDEAEASRDEALREFRQRHLGDRSLTAAIREIQTASLRITAMRGVAQSNPFRRDLADVIGKARLPGQKQLRRIFGKKTTI